MKKSDIEPRFLNDVRDHVMEVLRDDGLYRHVRFRKPGTMCMHFDMITWPGYLCYAGDMGTYVFWRLDDMFEFFRSDRAAPGRLAINPGYWSEKLQAVDGNRNSGSAKEFSEDRFTRVVREQLVQWWRDRDLDVAQRKQLREEVEDQILSKVGDDHTGSRAMNAAYEFSERIGGRNYQFQDLFDYDFTDYTHTFMWCCYALAWGIKTYDARHTEAVAA